MKIKLFLGLALMLGGIMSANSLSQQDKPGKPDQPDKPLTRAQLLSEVEKRAFNFFWHEANARTGLVKDRANNFEDDNYTAASIASTGFMLAALPIGVERGWVKKEDARKRALNTLRFFENEAETVHGWYYHFLDINTGKRMWKCELSSIDTGLLIIGALTAGQYFKGDVQKTANRLYERIDFDWMRTKGGKEPDQKFLSMGWHPEDNRGFINHIWWEYNEHLFLTLLGLGAEKNPLPQDTWDSWHRPVVTYKQWQTLRGGPAFFHQMSHVYIDFKDLRDRPGYNYWTSAINGTLINRQVCIDNKDKFKTYSENTWGLTACDAPDGYRAYDAPGHNDGTVAPTGAITSIFATPKESLEAMQGFYDKRRDKIWGRYGFSNAYNDDRNWYDKDVIGIDLGMMLLGIENERSGLIWKLTGSHPAIKRAMKRAGFKKDRSKELYVAPKPPGKKASDKK